MTSSDGKSAQSLRQRKSKRFDRSGGSTRSAGSAVAEVDPSEDSAVASPVVDDGPSGSATSAPTVVTSPEPEAENSPTSKPAGASPSASTATTGAPAAVPSGTDNTIRPDAPVRSKTLDELSTCGRCGHEVSMINIEVDSTALIMESCDNCDTRRWHLAGEQIDLQGALDHVGEHAGRRR